MNSHLSEDQIAEWVAGEPNTAAERHARECSQCAAEVLRTQRALGLFRESGHRCAERWRLQPPAASRNRFPALLATGTAVAALAAFCFLRPPAAPRREVFVPIPYVVPAAPYERTAIVPMDIPVAALIAAGLQVRTAGVAGTVPADVLVGQDGRALAISLTGEKDR